jgi:hypothetical protein
MNIHVAIACTNHSYLPSECVGIGLSYGTQQQKRRVSHVRGLIDEKVNGLLLFVSLPHLLFPPLYIHIHAIHAIHAVCGTCESGMREWSERDGGHTSNQLIPKANSFLMLSALHMRYSLVFCCIEETVTIFTIELLSTHGWWNEYQMNVKCKKEGSVCVCLHFFPR